MAFELRLELFEELLAPMKCEVDIVLTIVIGDLSEALLHCLVALGCEFLW